MNTPFPLDGIKVGDRVVAVQNAGKLVRKGDKAEVESFSQELVPGYGLAKVWFVTFRLVESGFLTRHRLTSRAFSRA